MAMDQVQVVMAKR